MQLKIGTRLGLGFGLLLVLFMGVSLFAVNRMQLLAQITAELYQHPFQVNDAVNNASIEIIKMHRSMKDVALATTPEEIDKAVGKVAASEKVALSSLEKARGLFLGNGKLVEEVAARVNEWRPIREEVIALKRAGQGAEAAMVTKIKGAPKVEQITGALDSLGAAAEQKAASFMKVAEETKGHTITLMLAITALALLVGVLSAFLLARSVLRPLRSMLDMLKDIAQGEGDLTKRLDCSTADELGEVSSWFNSFIEKLHRIIGEVAQHTAQLTVAASQLSANSLQIAAGAEEASGQTGTVATAGEEMAATSGDIAHNCAVAARLAQQANEKALAGSAVVRETVAAMTSITSLVQDTARTVSGLGERSDQIGAIIGTIEDIADQTNLLALNAAIEAARAGEQGRGFAVVADEVRALAERTTRATREIGEMIKSIQAETGGAVKSMQHGVEVVEMGAETAGRSGESLEEILRRIDEVTCQVNQIATAAEQQTATTSEISNNIQQITQVIQETAQGAQQSAGAARQLEDLSQGLQRVVRQFRLA